MDRSPGPVELPSPKPGDLRQPLLIHLKGWLFLVIALTAGALVVLRTQDVRIAALLAVCVWAACRFYYYAFYVIERYVDPTYRFAGLASVIRYLLRRGRR